MSNADDDEDLLEIGSEELPPLIVRAIRELETNEWASTDYETASDSSLTDSEQDFRDLPDVNEALPDEPEVDVPDTLGLSGLVTFPLDVLKAATGGLSDENIIGRGGFGQVFRGEIGGGNVVVKASVSKLSWERLQWEAEVASLHNLHHPNILWLIGKCETTHKFYLVYPYLERGDVYQNLQELDWPSAFRIFRGTTMAIRAIHKQTPALVHKDIKTSNVLHNNEWNPYLSDFGTAGPSSLRRICGTAGYCDPDSIRKGRQSKRTDMYGVGMFILQIIMKRRTLYNVWNGHNWDNIQSTAEALLLTLGHAAHRHMTESGCSEEAAERLTTIALQCLRKCKSTRPTIDDVVEMLTSIENDFPV